MHNELTPELFEKLSRLGGITVTDTERDAVEKDLRALMRAAGRLAEADIPETTEETAAACPLRPDEPAERADCADGTEFAVERIIQ